MLSEPAFGPKLSIGLIIAGALLDVWTLVWRFTLAGDPLTPSARFWYLGFLFTGLTFLFVGFFLGRIGRAARKAELPPPETVAAEATIQQTAAAHPPAIVPGVVRNGAVTSPATANPAVLNPALMNPANAQPVDLKH